MKNGLPLFDEPNVREAGGNTGLWMTSARIVDLSREMPSDLVRSDEELLRIARRHAPDPAIFTEHPPLFLPLRISNNSLDAYFTRMAPSSLKNYAKQAAAGVSFQDSHVTSRLGLGHSLTGDYLEEGDERASVYAYVFVTPGIEDTDKFIHRYRSGSVRDISIGFYGGMFRCSICNENMFGAPWRCPHWPGVEYDIEKRDERGEVIEKRTEMAFAWVEDAILSEISAVYDGATPDAVILKAERQITDGRMTPQVARMLNSRYRGLNLQLPATRIIAPGISDQSTTEAKPMPEERKPTSEPTVPTPAAPNDTASAAPLAADAAARTVADIGAILAEAGIAEADRADVVAGVRALATRFKAESEMAEVGRKYRSTLIEEALKEGVRAFGNTFNVEGRRSLLDKLEISEIETFRDDWRAQADSVLPRGRQTADEKSAPAAETPLQVPVGAYMA
jgi:hypothetical protein